MIGKKIFFLLFHQCNDTNTYCHVTMCFPPMHPKILHMATKNASSLTVFDLGG